MIQIYNYFINLYIIKIYIMAIPARPTGQDPQSQLLWQISKQLDTLIKIANKISSTTTTTTTV